MSDSPLRRPQFGWVPPERIALLTDLYEVTMAQGYWRLGMNDTATFDLFIREAPANRRFLVAAGLEPALAALESFCFDAAAIDYLGSLRRFDPAFLEWLRGVRFTGEVAAVPEGEPVLPGEPLLELTAPLIEGQLVETLLLNTVLFQCAVASKAARVVVAAAGRRVFDFSARRDHGADAAVKVARASYLAGCAGTSNLLAGHLYGIPTFGTLAHAYVMAFPTELEAFRSFAASFPDPPVLLIDTYDTLEGARRAVEVGGELRARGRTLGGVRIDSGDLGSLSVAVRSILDAGGFNDAKIFASGDLNEWKIEALVLQGAPIDGFGVGTEMGTSKDAPALGGVYKLAEYAGRPVVKRSPGKLTLPGRKQVWRRAPLDGTISRGDEEIPGARPLLETVMAAGRATVVPALDEIRARCADRLAELPADALDLAPCAEGACPSPAISEGLQAAADAVGSG